MPRKATRKTTAKKTTKKAAPKRAVKKTAAKKVTAKKAKPASAKLKSTAIRDAMTKSQVLTYIADATELSKKEVAAVFDVFHHVMHRHIKKGGAGQFNALGMKVQVKRKPATKAREGINPFTQERIMIKAKPARNVVKIRPLKKIKEMVE